MTAASGPRRRAERLPPEERRAQLVGAAVRAFSRSGITSTRHADVANEAGTSPATIFHYFPTRETLREAVVGEVEKMLKDFTESAAAPGVPPLETLKQISQGFIRAVDTQKDLVRIWLDWSTAVDDTLWTRYLVFHDWATEVIGAVIDQGQKSGDLRRDLHPEDVSRIFLGTAYEISQMKIRGAPSAQVDRLVDGLIALLRHSDAKPPA
jgi:AcrR family transcriptional regulator